MATDAVKVSAAIHTTARIQGPCRRALKGMRRAKRELIDTAKPRRKPSARRGIAATGNRLGAVSNPARRFRAVGSHLRGAPGGLSVRGRATGAPTDRKVA